MTVSAVFVLIGCSGSNSSDGTPTPTPTPTPALDPTLTNVQALVFTPSCTNIGCHDVSAGGGLNLKDGNAYGSLVNVPAQQTSAAALGTVRVVPGDPVNSFLVQKIDGTMLTDEGIPMPWSDTGLTSDAIDIIRRWIAAGAQNN